MDAILGFAMNLVDMLLEMPVILLPLPLVGASAAEMALALEIDRRPDEALGVLVAA